MKHDWFLGARVQHSNIVKMYVQGTCKADLKICFLRLWLHTLPQEIWSSHHASAHFCARLIEAGIPVQKWQRNNAGENLLCSREPALPHDFLERPDPPLSHMTKIHSELGTLELLNLLGIFGVKPHFRFFLCSFPSLFVVLQRVYQQPRSPTSKSKRHKRQINAGTVKPRDHQPLVALNKYLPSLRTVQRALSAQNRCLQHSLPGQLAKF